MILFVAGLVIGAAASWAIAHIYYKRASGEQEALFGKLEEDLRGVILSDKREGLTVPELYDLLEKNLIDSTAASQGDPLPYKTCPSCQSDLLRRGGGANDRGDQRFSITCEACGWSEDAYC